LAIKTVTIADKRNNCSGVFLSDIINIQTKEKNPSPSFLL
jgi:hypothetical protein